MGKKEKITACPTVPEIEKELKREQYRSRYSSVLKSTVYTLIVVAAIAVLVATLWMPVFQIYGTSMTPTLSENNIVVSLKGSSFTFGDIVAFYHGNKLLVKRVIAGPGQWVDIDAEGNVYVDGELLDEPYITEKAFGDVNIELPYQVGDGRYFVMGDHRLTSADSRNSTIGCISDEQIVGRIVYRVWPFSGFGKIE